MCCMNYTDQVKLWPGATSYNTGTGKSSVRASEAQVPIYEAHLHLYEAQHPTILNCRETWFTINIMKFIYTLLRHFFFTSSGTLLCSLSFRFQKQRCQPFIQTYFFMVLSFKYINWYCMVLCCIVWDNKA